MSGCAPMECQWLELLADLLATPLLMIPDEPIARQLITSFDVRGDATRSSTRAAPTPTWPPDLLDSSSSDLMRIPPDRQNYRRYAIAGATAEVYVMDIPDVCRKHWQARGWEVLCRTSGGQHDIYLPLQAPQEQSRFSWSVALKDIRCRRSSSPARCSGCWSDSSARLLSGRAARTTLICEGQPGCT
jgi:hypothetical protein